MLPIKRLKELNDDNVGKIDFTLIKKNEDWGVKNQDCY